METSYHHNLPSSTLIPRFSPCFPPTRWERQLLQATRRLVVRLADALSRAMAWQTSLLEPRSVLSRGVCGVTKEQAPWPARGTALEGLGVAVFTGNHHGETMDDGDLLFFWGGFTHWQFYGRSRVYKTSRGWKWGDNFVVIKYEHWLSWNILLSDIFPSSAKHLALHSCFVSFYF